MILHFINNVFWGLIFPTVHKSRALIMNEIEFSQNNGPFTWPSKFYFNTHWDKKLQKIQSNSHSKLGLVWVSFIVIVSHWFNVEFDQLFHSGRFVLKKVTKITWMCWKRSKMQFLPEVWHFSLHFSTGKYLTSQASFFIPLFFIVLLQFEIEKNPTVFSWLLTGSKNNINDLKY